jgi:hypothetical protein
MKIIFKKDLKNQLVDIVKKQKLIIFTFGVLFAYNLVTIFYFNWVSLSIWHSIITAPPVDDLLLWILVIWLTTKYSKNDLKQKFINHKIVTIILFVWLLVVVSNKLIFSFLFLNRQGNIIVTLLGIVSLFNVVLYSIFLFFILWFVICWISNKIFKKQKNQWSWYNNIVNKSFIILPKVYKVILGLITIYIISFIAYLVFFSDYMNGRFAG